MHKATDNALSVFNSICDVLQPLDDETRSRIVKSIVMFFNIDFHADSRLASDIIGGSSTEYVSPGNINSYSTFAEFYAVVKPSTNADKALVAGFWLQVYQEDLGGFRSREANKELANLGYSISNITDALSTLINTNPQLVLQVKKSGRSKQARKTYKLTEAGINRVKEMIDG